jgi:transcriptional regulator with XRE-family HTH domain
VPRKQAVKPPQTKQVRASFAEQLKRFRDQRAWSQERLASEMTALGLKLDQSAVARVEAGKRTVSLEEALGFAVALGVQPAALIVPAETTTFELVPNPQRWVDAESAWEWIAGRRAIGPMQAPYESIDDAIPAFVEHENTTNRFYYQSVSDDEAEAIRLLPEIHDIFLEAGYLKGTARAFVRQRDPAGTLGILHGQLDILRDEVTAAIEKIERMMRKASLESVPPPARTLTHPSHRTKRG